MISSLSLRFLLKPLKSYVSENVFNRGHPQRMPTQSERGDGGGKFNKNGHMRTRGEGSGVDQEWTSTLHD